MRIIETFICWSDKYDAYVKVHRCRESNHNQVCFIELKGGSLRRLTDQEYNQIMNV